MLTGLDILLDRMKTNPEEFLNAGGEAPYEGQMFGGKWADLCTYAWRVSTEEERKMFEEAQRQFYRDDFNERVMKRLAGEDRSDVQETMVVKTQGRYGLGWSDLHGKWVDPRNAMMAQEQGYQIASQPQIKQEGEPVGGMGNGFWGGLANSLRAQK